MKSISFKSEDENYLNDLISRAFSCYDGGGISRRQIDKYDKLTEIISSLLDIPGYEKWSKRKTNLVKALITPSSKVDSINQLIASFASIQENNSGSQISVSVYSRMHLKGLESIIHKTHFDSQITVVSQDHLNQILSSSHNIKTQNRKNDEFWKYVREGIWINVDAIDVSYNLSAMAAIRVSEMLRNLVNFALLDTMSISKSAPGPVSRIAPSQYYFPAVDGNITFWKYSIYESFRDYDIPEDKRSLVKSFIGNFDAIPETNFKKSIEYSMQLFGEAIDSFSYDRMFVLLWSSVDSLIQGKRVNLLQNLYPDSKDDKTLIIALNEKRNRLIHEGKVEYIDQEEVKMMIAVVIRLIVFAMRAADELTNTQEFSFFVGNLSNPKKARDSEILQLLVEGKMFP